MYFWTYWLCKTWCDKCLKKPVLENLSTSNMVNRPQHFWNIYWSLWRPFTWKKSALVIRKFLGLFVNTLTGDDKYSLLNRDNILQHLQMKLYQKQKNISPYFFAFWKSWFSFQHFQKIDEPYSWCIFELTDAKKLG